MEIVKNPQKSILSRIAKKTLQFEILIDIFILTRYYNQNNFRNNMFPTLQARVHAYFWWFVALGITGFLFVSTFKTLASQF